MATKLNKLPARLGTVSTRLPTLQDGSWRTDKQTAAQRGYGYKWQQARAGYLAKHPLCVYCAKDGRVTAATVVDHIIPHRGDMSSLPGGFWHRDGWQSLCKACHDEIKAVEERKAGLR